MKKDRWQLQSRCWPQVTDMVRGKTVLETDWKKVTAGEVWKRHGVNDSICFLKVAVDYMKGMFVLDVLGSFPWEVLSQGDETSSGVPI